MDNYITRQEHEEFLRRMEAEWKRRDDENKRQNSRIGVLEENVRQINALTVSVEKMAVNMENMLEEQKKQGERLEALEKEPAETSRKVRMAIVTAVISSVVGAVVGAVLMLL